jgi:hypothetical protein
VTLASTLECPIEISTQAAYAMEQSKAEEQRAIQWAAKWAPIWERVATVLKLQLSGPDKSDMIVLETLPELVVEIEGEDKDEDDEDGSEGDE